MDNKKKIMFLGFFSLIIVLLILINQYGSVNLSIVSLMSVYIGLLLISLKKIKEKYLLFLFLIVFFVFTMGQYLFPNYTNWLYYNQYSDDIIKETIFIQSIALMFTYFGFNCYLEKKTDCHNFFVPLKWQKRGLILLLCFFLLAIMVNVEIGFRVIKYGYLIIYSNDVPSVFPSFIKYLASFYTLMVFIFLFFAKDKHIYKLVLLMYFVYLCSTLFTGTRGEFCIGILIILIDLFVHYFLIKKIKIDKKKIILASLIITVMIPLAGIGLNIFNSIRNKETVDNKNLYVQFANFFTNQGSSVNLISLGLKNERQLDLNKHIYTFGPVLENVQYKINKVFHLDLIGEKHSSFAKDISIIGLGEEGYLSGQGLGSQYLAELYLDYGIIGVIIYSLMLGFLLHFLSTFYRGGFIKYSLSLIIIQSILFLPRNQALQFINAIFSVNYWGLIILILLFMFIYKRRSHYV